MTVLNYLENTALRFPDKTAVSDKNGSYTFSELRKGALTIAGYITNKLCGQTRQPILVHLPKSRECLCAFMGVAYSGNIYTPTDVRYPFAKLQSVIDVLRPVLYITDINNAKKLLENGILQEDILVFDDIINLKNIEQNEAGYDINAVLKSVIDTDAVYILFTSGSTGIPKGVVISHRSIIDYIEWMADEYKIDSTAIMGNQAPFFFDISVPDIYLCLKTGAQLHIIPEQYFSFPDTLMKEVAEKSINFIFWVPSVLISVANNDILGPADCSCLKHIFFGGEVMPCKQLNYWRRHIPDAIYSNLYGPTEITGTCIYYTVDREFTDNEPLPIGYPCANTDVLLLDSENLPVTKPGIQGEIYIRGSSLAHGYWNDEGKTADAFIQNPANPHYPERVYRTGDLAHYNDRYELMFDGRRDFQIKHMGYRIELGEIETAATGIAGVTAASAGYDDKKQEIVLFFTGNIDKKELRKILLESLPKYMVPARCVQTDEFPYNDNGKIDRIKLREIYIAKD